MSASIEISENGRVWRVARKDGLTPSVGRGMLGTTPWSAAFIAAALAEVDPDVRRQGRRAAQQKHILDLNVCTGRAAVDVRDGVGSDKSRRVLLTCAPLQPADWATLVDAVAADAMLAADLLNGGVADALLHRPPDAAALVPTHHDLATACGCEAGPRCSHVAAATFMLADVMDRYPFLLFLLRGMSRTDFLGQLWQRHGITGTGSGAAPEPPPLKQTPDFFAFHDDIGPFPKHAGEDITDPVGQLGNPPFAPDGDRSLVGVLRRLRDDQ